MFIIHHDKEPYKEVQRISLPTHGYNQVQLVKDCRSSPRDLKNKLFVAVLHSSKDLSEPFALAKFKQKEDGEHCNNVLVRPVERGADASYLFKDAFLVNED